MSQVELSCGIAEHTDTGGRGPVLVLLHGPDRLAGLIREFVRS